MSDALGAPASLSDDDLERRLRATYVALARSTRHGRTTLDARAAGPTWRRQPLRLVMVAAAVVLLAGLGAVVTQRRDDGASGALDGPRWAIVTPGSGWQYLGIAPYDRAVDGLGAHVGEVIRFGRGDAVLGGAEVDVLEGYLGVIEVARDRALGVETHGAAGVIEGSDGFAHGIFVCGGFLLCGEKRNASLNVNLTHPCARS